MVFVDIFDIYTIKIYAFILIFIIVFTKILRSISDTNWGRCSHPPQIPLVEVKIQATANFCKGT